MSKGSELIKKRILLVVPSLEIGGQERVAVNTAEGLKNEYDVEIVIFQRRDVDGYNVDCNVINLDIPTKNRKLSKIINQIKRSIRLSRIRNAKKIDYVISFGNTANISNVISGIIGRGKSICGIHGFAELRAKRVLDLVVKLSDRVICITHAMQAELLKQYPTCQKSVVIENGFFFSKKCDDSVIGFESKEPIYVSMGRLEYVKGFDLLIEAFEIVVQTIPKAQLWLVGDGSARRSLEDQAMTKHLQNNIRFWGYQKNPQHILKEASIYVLSSRNEGLSNAIVEALNVELPVIAIDCECGPREILSGKYREKETKNIEYVSYGVLVENFCDEKKRVEYLARAMSDLANNKKEQDNFRKKALSRSEDFSMNMYVKKINRMLDSL